LRTIANVFFFVGVGALFYAGVLIVAALWGTVIEF
jgi:hypothetical protein